MFIGVRYLVASDLHYALRQLDWISEQAPDFDAVILAGDLLDAAGAVELNAQIALFVNYLRRLAERTVLVVCSGNHDLTGRRFDGEKAAVWMEEIGDPVVTDGSAVRIGRDALVRPEGPWIWAYHSPPADSPTSWSGRRHFGDDVLNELIDRFAPDLVLTGHVHEAPYQRDGSWHDMIGGTTVLNAGRQLGPVPAHLIVDTMDRTADWWTFEGQGTVAF
jgi:Icc-related predicted phosphoesterase